MTNLPEPLTVVDALRALAVSLGDHSTLTREGALSLARRGAWELRAPALVLAALDGRTVKRVRWLRALSDLALEHDDDAHPRALQAIVASLALTGDVLTAEQAADIASHVVQGFSGDGNETPADLETLLAHLAEIVEPMTAPPDPDSYPTDEARLIRAPAQIAACTSVAEVVAVIDTLITVQPGAIPMEDGRRTPPFSPVVEGYCNDCGAETDDGLEAGTELGHEMLDHVGPLVAALRAWLVRADDDARQQKLSAAGAKG